MPRIDLTECAARGGWKANKSGRDSVRRHFLQTDEQRAALQYDCIIGKGTVDEVAFMGALDVWRQERLRAGTPARNLGAFAIRGLSRSEQRSRFCAQHRTERKARNRSRGTDAQGR